MTWRNLMIFSLLVGLWACGKDDNNNNNSNNNNNNNNQNATLKVSVAPDKTLIDSGETVTFTNNSTADSSRDWVVDSKHFYTKNLSYTFSKRGTYDVKLTVYNKDNSQNDDTTITITVGSRYLTGFNFKKYSSAKEGDNTGPDIYVNFGPVKDAQKYKTTIKQDADGSAFTLPLTDAIKMDDTNNGAWVFRLIDDNGTNQASPITTFPGQGAAQIYPSRGLNPGSNPIVLVNNSAFNVELNYEIRP